MKSKTFAVKLSILTCLLRLTGYIMADLTNIPNSDLIYYSDTGDTLSYKNATPALPYIAYTNTSSSSTFNSSQFSVNSENIYFYVNCHNEGVCSIECDSGNADILFLELTPIYNQQIGCSACGISVILTAGVDFPGNRVRSAWLIGDIRLSRFEVSLKGVTNIESNAFSDQAFRFLETLVLTDLQITVFNNGTFNGLISLRSLRLYALKTYDFTPGFLTGISATLSYLVLNGPGNFKIRNNNIDGITGGIALPLVRLFQVTTNLNGSLSPKTFSGFRSIRVLILSDCQIEVILPEIFEPIQSTLQKLYLERNRLKTIHQNLFTMIYQRDMMIYLNGNPLHCDSNMETYKIYLLQFAWRYKGFEPTCASPAYLRNVPVMDADIWADPPETTDETTLRPTVEPPATVGGVIYPECASSSLPSEIASVPIERQTLTLGLSQNEKGELMVTQTSKISSALTLVWFQSDSQLVFHQNISTLNCLRLISFKTVIQNLVVNTAYTFCLIDQNSLVLSPWNCGSYYHRIHKNGTAWFAADNIAYAIVGTSFALMLSLIFGTVLGVLILRQYPNCKILNVFDIKILQSKSDIHKSTYISNEMQKWLSEPRVAAEMPEFNASDMKASEVNDNKMDLEKFAIKYEKHSESLNYPENMPCDVAPQLPARL